MWHCLCLPKWCKIQSHLLYVFSLILFIFSRLKLENSKTKYYFKLANKLSSKKLNQKCYWSILKSFLNGKKIPCIPPIFHNDNFITDIREKSELFNTFFAQQCSLIENSSTLPTCIFPKTDKSLSTIYFSEEDIIRLLDPNKFMVTIILVFGW